MGDYDRFPCYLTHSLLYCCLLATLHVGEQDNLRMTVKQSKQQVVLNNYMVRSFRKFQWPPVDFSPITAPQQDRDASELTVLSTGGISISLEAVERVLSHQ